MKYQEMYDLNGSSFLINNYRGEEICEQLKYSLKHCDCYDNMIENIAKHYVDKNQDNLLDSLADLMRDGYYDQLKQKIGLSGNLIEDIKAAQYLAYKDCLYRNVELVARNIAYDILAAWQINPNIFEKDTVESIVSSLSSDNGYEDKNFIKTLNSDLEEIIIIRH